MSSAVRNLAPVRRPWSIALAIAFLLAGALCATAQAGFYAGDPIDGPSPELSALGDLDLARDATGALAYVRAVGGVDHVFVTRFEGGIFLAPERIDGALPGPSSQPVVGAADRGRLAIVFVNAGTVYGVVRPVGAGYNAPVPLGAGTNPAVDLSINGSAFATFTSAENVAIARLDRRSNAWSTLAQPADVDPARPAGVGDGRSRVSISADGVGVVTWGESGHVYARKMFNGGVSNAPQDLTPPTFAGRVSTTSDLPDIDAEDDSSYAWAVFRQSFADGGSRMLARRQRGTGFEAPVAVDTGDEPVRDPRIDLNGRGMGLATSAGVGTSQPMTALLDKRDVFGPGVRIFGPSAAPPVSVPSISDNNSSFLATVLAAGGPAAVYVRRYDDGKTEQDFLLSRPDFGPVAPELGFDAAVDRAGGLVVAWMQGGPADRRLVGGYFDRPPASFLGHTSTRCCRGPLPVLSWQAAFNLWGSTRYEVLVDGKVIGQTTDTKIALPAPLTDATHRWQVRATDIRGQLTRSKTRNVRVDARGPLLSVGYKRKGRVVTISAKARDDGRAPSRTSGMQEVVISWGDRSTGTRAVSRSRARHRYPRGGTYPLTITARDKAGNERVVKRTVRIG